MIRRSFRIGLWLGLLVGIAFALAKLLRPKHDSPAVIDLGTPGASVVPTSTAWPPLEAAAPAPAPAAPEPVAKPVAKRPAAKKAAPAKASAPAKKSAAPKTTIAPWVDPDGNVCPQTHPVKGKLSSMIFQSPGNVAYDRTKPDRCYASAEAAQADGLRAAKR